MSYSFLVDAIRRYGDNPNPETKAELEHAQLMADLCDLVFWMICIVIVCWLMFLIRRDFAKLKKAFARK
jgi:hypothetical protein